MGPKRLNKAIKTRSAGFSLIELTVVILIVVILLTLGAGAISLAVENSAFSQTRKKQDTIKDALSTYLGKFKRLPCPDVLGVGNVQGTGDDNRATPNDVSTACTSNVGVIPYIDLGIPREFALDGWDNFFTYRVSTDADPVLDWTRSGNFAVGKPGKISVVRRDPATSAATTALAPAPELAVAVVVSHGKNGLGAFTAQGTQNVAPAAATDEGENADGTTNLTFVQRDITDVDVPTYGPYDDVILFVRASELVAPLVRDTTLRSAEGETNYQIGLMSDEAIGLYVSSPNDPDPGASTVPTAVTIRRDGWGMPIAYYQCVTQITATTSATLIAFRIVSGGGDRVLATAGCAGTVDAADVGLEIQAGTLRTLFVKAGKALPP